MKKVILLLISLLFPTYLYATSTQTFYDLTALEASPAADDITYIFDVSDTTDSIYGTDKKISTTNLFGNLADAGANTDITSLAGLTTPLGPAYGGTGIANNAASTWTISGGYATTVTVTGITAITLPTSGTLLATDGVGTNLTALNGENIQNDTIDDDSIDFSDVTLADITFDVGSVDTTEFGYLNGVTSAIQTQLDARALESVVGTSISTGLLLDGTALKVSAILQEYHAVDPTSHGLTLAQLTDPGSDGVLIWDDDPGNHEYGTIGTGLLYNGSTLSVSAILQEYHAVDPAAPRLTVNQLTDTDADYVAFWDDSASSFQPLTMGDNLSITDQTLNASSVVSWPTGNTGGILYSGGGSDPTFGDYLDIPALTAAPGSPVAGRFYRADNSTWDPCDLAGTNDYWVMYDGSDYLLFWDILGNLYIADLDLSGGTFIFPNSTTSGTLSSPGQSYINTTNELVEYHSAADGEISGETATSIILKKEWSFDPVTVYNTTLHRMPLMELGLTEPFGITIDKWTYSFDANPTAEIDADLMRADAFIEVANSAIVDVLDTIDGYSSENTDANINAGAVIATGKFLYLVINTAYTETGHSCILTIYYHLESD